MHCSISSVRRGLSAERQNQAADRKATLKSRPDRDDGEVIPTKGETFAVVHAAFKDAIAGSEKPGVRDVVTYFCSRVDGAALRGSPSKSTRAVQRGAS